MDDNRSIDLHRFAGLYQSLAGAVMELAPDDRVIYASGNLDRLLGCGSGGLMGQCFTAYIHSKDFAIWRLVRHKLMKSGHVGPVPLRMLRADGVPGAIELHAVRTPGAEPGTIQLSISPYWGQLSIGENKRAPSSSPRQFDKQHFAKLAQRLTEYAAGTDHSVPEALMKLAGLDEQAGQGKAEVSLWALHRLLGDAAAEGAAADLSETKREAHRPEGVACPDERQQVSNAMRGAFKQGRDEANYVTVAGEDGISESDAVKAAVYAMKRAASKENAKTIQALTGGYERRLEKVKAQLKAFKQIVLQERFDVALQPIVDIHDGTLHHFEALARFDQNIFAGSPFEFMCFAEDIGVIHEFDLAMTMKVVSLIKRMRRIGYNVAAAVNISGHSIQSQGFLRHFFNILEDCGDIRENLMFELTESSQIDDLETTNRILRRIRDFGHKVSLDDFGAGAAGLQYLRVLKVDCVKIDGIYIRKGLEDAENRSFLRSMADLCKGLGIETVGECVENEEQRRFLEEIGVNYAQGWLYGKPMPPDEALQFLQG
ncbi:MULTISPECIES: sensor domain-containing phosphodiesterase [Kordiimonas]|jgi:EAL domain-containing protein (putative c-di-GMP-specific phosphodiesterase class I)|uniref:EAL domain, c-di-GMP-specific phosphodiesterase class I (Or its enzymatically inactive variant) n=1 Tax=Kordiimonas lacus TaxID=637679 RepID=A0A1G6VHX1_9PROT|nr:MULTISPECIES: EAL domain-containing protein [Kordiimonas]SDD52973.1 EAL domain, c-di-GMP-specific phosphodiesterase class I (or its enzymatically inactive variant) [Kordiimonas lacus]